MMTDNADDEITPEEEATQFAKQEYDLPDLFSRPIEGDGLLGDVVIGPDLNDLVGEHVAAKRHLWDEVLTPEQELDHTPYDEMEYESDDLSGVLSVLRFTLPDGTPGVIWEVGGQPADPKTIRHISDDGK